MLLLSEILSEQDFDTTCTQPLDKFKILFNASTDFYGRVTIYKLDILGVESW